MNINVGETDQELIDELVNLYQNSNKTYFNVQEHYHFGNESHFDERHDYDGKKSLLFKVMDTINRYCFEEYIPRD